MKKYIFAMLCYMNNKKSSKWWKCYNKCTRCLLGSWFGSKDSQKVVLSISNGDLDLNYKIPSGKSSGIDNKWIQDLGNNKWWNTAYENAERLIDDNVTAFNHL